MRRLLLSTAVASALLLVAASASAQKRWRPRRPGEIFGGIGVGGAFCNTDDARSNCADSAAIAASFGGGFRFHRHLSVGLELGYWGFRSPSDFRGGVPSPNDVTFSSHYVAPYFRWYWTAHGTIDAYLHLGLGLGWVNGHSGAPGTSFDRDVRGVVFPIGVGVEWYLGSHFRLGPQFLVYLQHGLRTCETTNGVEVCRDPNSAESIIPWRILLMGTVMFGR